MVSSKKQLTALLSVYDKTHLVPFAKALVSKFGYRLLATGGTYKALREEGIDATNLETLTGFETLIDGRVKSLHPRVFAGILANRANATHMAQVDPAIDLVVVNLYPFEQGFQANSNGDASVDLVELIDIGGSSLIRAGAKNHNAVTVITEPSLYEVVLTDMLANQGQTSLGLRKRLALLAFERSAGYDNAIAGWLTQTLKAEMHEESASQLPATLSVTLHNIQPMRYGENPHQAAALYAKDPNAVDFTVLNGKALSYNNLLDMEAAWALMSEFVDEPTVAIIKHTQPCGVASGATLAKAWERALDCDPLSAFGGIVALNKPVDEKTAKSMVDLFLEVVIAPGFSEQALDILTQKKNLRLVTRHWPTAEEAHPASLRDGRYIRQVSSNLYLVQEAEHFKGEALLEQQLKVVTKAKPTQEQLQDAAFAWRVAKPLACVVDKPAEWALLSKR
jgi:phosphoribosylaminoimidazolecarboxamide formyltransferase / IMP cyclohydrolase